MYTTTISVPPASTVYCIIDPCRVGKSTRCRVLARKCGDTSDVICRSLGITKSTLNPAERELLRDLMIRRGNALCEQDPAFLSRQLLREGCTIIGRIRRRSELVALRHHLAVMGACVRVIWIDRDPELRDTGGKEIKDNLDLTPLDADARVATNSSIDVLEQSILQAA